MPCWKLIKRFRFEAAHQLPNHNGKCKRLHGHSWNGHVVLEHHSLKDRGHDIDMLVDFYQIGQVLASVVNENLDHYFLNDSLPLDNPTSERIAQWMFEQLRGRIPYLVAVVIEETCTSACEYRP